MTIKTLMGVVIVAVVTGSAVAAVQLVDSPTSRRPASPLAPSASAPATSSGALVYVMSEHAGPYSAGAGRWGRRAPRVVVLTPRPSEATR